MPFIKGNTIGAATRFKTGQSGNPAGRPPDRLRKRIEAELEKIASSEPGEARTKLELLAETIVDDALRGDSQSRKLLIERLYPMLNRHEIAGAEGEAINRARSSRGKIEQREVESRRARRDTKGAAQERAASRGAGRWKLDRQRTYRDRADRSGARPFISQRCPALTGVGPGTTGTRPALPRLSPHRVGLAGEKRSRVSVTVVIRGLRPGRRGGDQANLRPSFARAGRVSR